MFFSTGSGEKEREKEGEKEGKKEGERGIGPPDSPRPSHSRMVRNDALAGQQM
jgi:hypothetical protein